MSNNEIDSSIQYRVPVGEDGAVANFDGPRETIAEMYPEWASSDGRVYVSPEYATDGIAMQAFNSSLRFMNEGDRVAVLGNTVKRLCPFVPEGKISCEDCAFKGLKVAGGVEKNCARSNTADAFEQMNVSVEGRLMLLPTKSDVIVLGDELPGIVETNDNGILYRTLPAAQAVVITESSADKLGLSRFGIGMNGADSSFGMATFTLDGEKVAIPFCSTRQNMGDRSYEEQVIRKAIDALLDTRGYEGNERQEKIASLAISVMIGASASLANFGHKVQVPREGEDAPEREQNYAKQLRGKYPELIAKSRTGEITSAIVLNDQFQGALERGNVWPELDAGIVELARSKGDDMESPITPDNCPGDGQMCHVDYPRETEYAIVKQLQEMGVRSVSYDNSHAMDPADINNMASNRREQNEGVEVSKTNRTINGMVVTF
jgi:hypothetical protein